MSGGTRFRPSRLSTTVRAWTLANQPYIMSAIGIRQSRYWQLSSWLLQMASEISRTLQAYRQALEESRGRYEALYTTRGQNALDFYQRYANQLVRPFARMFSDVAIRRRLHRQIERCFGTHTLDFVAIDG